MEKSYKRFEVSDTKWWNTISEHFLVARLRLTFFYALTATIILAGSSMVIYRTILTNIAESLRDDRINPQVARVVFDHTKDMLQSRLIMIDLIIVGIVVLIGFLLTKKTLAPLKETMEIQKRFIADASHELRTPIAVVTSGLEVALRNKQLSLADARTTLENTLTEVRDFTVLANQLLDISKYTTPEARAYTPVAINTIIQSVVEKMRPLAHEKNITMEYKNTVSAKVFGDEAELARVFYNICANAIAYTKENGTITITESMTKTHYAVMIIDTGVGIPFAIRDTLFDPFVRGDSARHTSGAGLGLTLVKKIIENHKGTIAIESVVDKGTTVKITLPLSS